MIIPIMDRVGFEPTTSAMPMPHPTGLDDRPSNIQQFVLFVINTFNELQTLARSIPISYIYGRLSWLLVYKQ